MAHRLGPPAIIAAVIACIGCNRSPAAPNPGGPESGGPISGSGVYATPPIRGLVRETNGGPIAGVMVRLVPTTGPAVSSPSVVSDDRGIFVVPSATDVCQAAHTFRLEVSKTGYRFPFLAAMSCAQVANPPEVTLEVKGQRAVTAVSGVPVEITLSNDDLNWLTDENGYSCGPCRIVALELPSRGPVAIRVEWSGPTPIFVWVEGDRWAGDLVRLREVVPPFGASDANLTIPIEWRESYLVLKVGLPYGGRFPAGSAPVSVRIEVRT